jgi:hypothetical protein
MKRLAEEEAASAMEARRRAGEPGLMARFQRYFIGSLLMSVIGALGVYQATTLIAEALLGSTPGPESDTYQRLLVWPQIAGGFFIMIALLVCDSAVQRFGSSAVLRFCGSAVLRFCVVRNNRRERSAP